MKKIALLFIALISFFSLTKGQNLPVAVEDFFIYVGYGQPDTLDLLANDYHPDGLPIELSAVGNSQIGATRTLLGNGCIKYTHFTNEATYDTIEYSIIESGNINSMVWSRVIIRVVPNSGGIDHNDLLDINKIKARIFNSGFLFRDPQTYSDEFALEYPKGSGKLTMYNAVPWIGSKLGDSLFLSADRYGAFLPEYIAGPICNNISYDSLDGDYRLKWDAIWKVTKEEIEFHKINFEDTNYLTPYGIKFWPAHGDLNYGHAQNLAPFIDLNEDGIYQPELGEYPDILGEQAIYFIFNDEESHSATFGESFPLKLEVHGMAFAFSSQIDAFDHSFFINYKFYNRSERDYDSTYLALFADFDLGIAFDDYMGCDVQRGTFFAYNGSSLDDVYGNNPPAQGITFLRGPKMDEDGTDNPAYNSETGENVGFAINGFGFGDEIIDNECFGLTSTIFLNNGGSASADPTYAEGYYNIMQSKWKNGTPLHYGGNGCNLDTTEFESRFHFPGESDPFFWGTNGTDPQYGQSWDEYTLSNPSNDRRGVGAMGPFTFEAGSCEDILIAFVTAHDSVQPWPNGSLNKLNEYVDEIRNHFFENPDINNWTVDVNNQTHQNKEVMKVFPNPTASSFSLGLRELSKNARYELYDLTGKLLQIGSISNNQQKINVDAQNNGLYILKVYNGNDIYNQKIIKH